MHTEYDIEKFDAEEVEIQYWFNKLSSKKDREKRFEVKKIKKLLEECYNGF